MGHKNLKFLVPGAVPVVTADQRLTSVLNWEPPQDPNGEIIAYEVMYRVNDTDIITINTTDRRVILEPVPQNSISVQAYTSKGPGNVTIIHYMSTGNVVLH